MTSAGRAEPDEVSGVGHGDGPTTSEDVEQGWMRRMFTEAAERYAELPVWARPVWTPPQGCVVWSQDQPVIPAKNEATRWDA